MRKHAWVFAKKTLPRRHSFKTVFDALQLEKCEGVAPPSTTDAYFARSFPTPTDGSVFFVDSNATIEGDGSKASPFSTLAAAIKTCKNGAQMTIVLRGGVHYTEGLLLTAMHSGMTIQNFEGENAVVSGAVHVPVSKSKWSQHNAATNTWKLDLSGWQHMPTESFGMRVRSKRAVRARFPDGDPEQGTGICHEHPAYIDTASYTAPSIPLKVFVSNPGDWPGVFWLAEPEGGTLPNTGTNFGGTGRWADSYGGVCSSRQAPFGYWCSTANSRSQAQNDLYPPYASVGGFTYANTSVAARVSNWSRPQGAVYHTHTVFASTQCLVTKVENNTVHFDPTIGCDQTGVSVVRPRHDFQGFAHGWYVDNVLEECDSPGEYFHDAEEKALYYTFNATEQPTGNEDFALTTTKVIFNVSGTQTQPVKGVTIRGLTIRDTALTYLGTTAADVHYIASDSDWTVQRSGAVLLEGTEGFVFESNEVTRCDGNGVFLSNYNRNATIQGNEFSWIGDSAMSAFGSTGRCLNANCSVRLDYPSGVDGRGGNQPRFTRVVGNLVREVGLYQKQSAAWVQHLTAKTHIESNVFFNMPQTAVGFNDGFGGGDHVAGNLIFNTNRQTIAHGVINAWERMPYISDIGVIRNVSKAAINTTMEMPSLQQLNAGFIPGFSPAPAGVGSVVSQFRRVYKNFLIANYNSLSAVTLDDAASRFLMYSNLFTHGQIGVGESCHNSQWVFGAGNLYAYTTNGQYNGCCSAVSGALIAGEGPSPTGVRTFFYNSTFLNLRDADWCNNRELTKLNLSQFWNNEVHSPTGKATGPACNGANNTISGVRWQTPKPQRGRLQCCTPIHGPLR
jgi:hypothetical protein